MCIVKWKTACMRNNQHRGAAGTACTVIASGVLRAHVVDAALSRVDAALGTADNLTLTVLAGEPWAPVLRGLPACTGEKNGSVALHVLPKDLPGTSLFDATGPLAFGSRRSRNESLACRGICTGL